MFEVEKAGINIAVQLCGTQSALAKLINHTPKPSSAGWWRASDASLLSLRLAEKLLTPSSTQILSTPHSCLTPVLYQLFTHAA